MFIGYILCLSLFFNSINGDGDVDPDIFSEIHMSPKEFIVKRGYPYENYEVTTEDGFILQLHRIPHGKQQTSKSKGVVYLQHGLLCTSCDFLMNAANISLGYILADAGYDVWLGDIRGNKFSRKHVAYSPSNTEFWDWSHDEMSKYDLPALIDFVTEKTGKEQIFYVGHSQGTMIAFAAFSANQKLAKKIKAFFALAPVVYLDNIKAPIRAIAPFSTAFSLLTDLLGSKEFAPNDAFMNWISEHACTILESALCSNWLAITGGPDMGNTDRKRVPIYFGHYPAGTSVKNIAHFSQGIMKSSFSMYDYGFIGNLKKYGKLQAPEYDLTKMNVPTILFWSTQDWLADPIDVEKLIPKLHKVVGNFKFENANHFDFTYGTNAPKDYYAKIVEFMNGMV